MKLCLDCGFKFQFTSHKCPACNISPITTNGFPTYAPEMARNIGGFRSEFFPELYQLEAENFWFRARNQLIIWALQSYKTNARNFLEVGCGTGFVLSGIARACPRLVLSGSEILLAGLSYAAKRVPSAHFMQMDARSVPFVEEFDAIGAFDVLEHIKEDELVLTQLQNALMPGGVLLLTVPQHPWLWSSSDEHACHVRRYRRAEIEQKILTAGFKLLRSSSFVTSLLPAMMLSRFLRKNARDFDPVSDLQINPVLNKSFYALMMLEVAGIRYGLNYPAGGSRLIVAERKS